MMFRFDAPNSVFLARHDTVGVVDECDAMALAQAFQSGQTGGRIAVVQENMRAALEALGAAQEMGRA
ncbi:MAG TPA: hypothetical protein VIU44_16965 [Gaiellaceae bacterium]